jgi:hypothetical protein
MNLSNKYYNKYKKYKSKYLNLLNQSASKSNSINSNDSKMHLIINVKKNPNNIIIANSSNTYNNVLTQPISIGSGYFYEQNDLINKTNMLEKVPREIYNFTSVYLKVNLTNPQIIKKYNKIRKTILKNNSFPPHNYHMTLLIFEINLNYPVIGNIISQIDKMSKKKKLRQDLDFLNQEEIAKDFKEIFHNVTLTTIDYEILGKLTKIKLESGKNIEVGVKNPESNDCVKYPGSYFVDHFEVNNKNLITTFRTKFYERMNEFVKLEYLKMGGKEKNYVGYRADNETDPDYILIFYDNFTKNIPLLAIKKFYYGKNTWAPHISIFNMEELVTDNMIFLKKYIVNFLTWQDKTLTNTMIFDELKKSKQVKELFKKTARPKLTINDVEFELQS